MHVVYNIYSLIYINTWYKYSCWHTVKMFMYNTYFILPRDDLVALEQEKKNQIQMKVIKERCSIMIIF